MKKKINKNEKFYIVRVEASDFSQGIFENILDMTIDVRVEASDFGQEIFKNILNMTIGAFNSQRKKNDVSYMEMKYTEKK